MPRGAWLAAIVVVALTTVFGGSCVLGRWDLARRKEVLLATVRAERALLPERHRTLALAMDEVVLEATGPWAGDFAAPGLESPEARGRLFSRSMLYVRAALPEVSRLDAIGAAVRRSEKDTVALCLVKPPASAAPEDVRAAATRYWIGGALFEDATHDVFPLYAVHKGLRPIGRAFEAEIVEADASIWVHRLEDEYAERSTSSLALARIAAESELLVVVVDELPEGFTPPDTGKSLTATRRPAILPQIEDQPHLVRAVVWSAERRSVVLRTRTRVDASKERTPAGGYPLAPSALHGCQVALALRGIAS